jgi:2-oxoglutarate dehydrogenase E2 component (dihydrolipoamide succinyltransferase)
MAIIDIIVPSVGESISEVTIGSWIKKSGDIVKRDEIICSLDSDKASFDVTAEGDGVLQIKVAEGETVPIGTLICTIDANVAPPAPSEGAATLTPASAAPPSGAAGAAATPVAANILAEKGIDPATIQGSGSGGKITKEDALKATAAPSVGAATLTPASAAPSSGATTGAGRRVKMTSLRKTIARRLVAVKNETAMLTTFNEVDMKPIMDLRAKYKDKFKEKHAVGLGFMSFFTKAVCVALQDFPIVNAFIDGDEIVYNDHCDISIAVSTERGLVVPIIRKAETMSFSQIESEIVRLAGLARDNKLTIDQMQGGSFTITNGGIFGSMLSTPIINAPQAAILGMHNIVDRAVVVNGEIVVRPIMYVALSYDHRTIDGRDSVGFLVRIKQLLEDPTRLLLGV